MTRSTKRTSQTNRPNRMKRLDTSRLRATCAAALAAAMGLLLLAPIGCDSGSQQRRRAAAPQPRSPEMAAQLMKLAEMSPEERLAAVWSWPENAGPARDLSQDDKDCNAQLDQDQSLRFRPKLARLPRLTRCMKMKGWIPKELPAVTETPPASESPAAAEATAVPDSGDATGTPSPSEG